jgi:hypothetical protein
MIRGMSKCQKLKFFQRSNTPKKLDKGIWYVLACRNLQRGMGRCTACEADRMQPSRPMGPRKLKINFPLKLVFMGARSGNGGSIPVKTKRLDSLTN